MASRKSLLDKLMVTLVEEWGPSDVQAALAKAIDHASASSEMSTSGYRTGRLARQSAAEQVEGEKITGQKKEAILMIARRFDQKEFLPSVADAREFLIMSGERPPGLKDRAQAWRELLRVFIRLSPERLESIKQSVAVTSPEQFGIISDAIAAAGERLPREHSETFQNRDRTSNVPEKKRYGPETVAMPSQNSSDSPKSATGEAKPSRPQRHKPTRS